MHIMRLCQGQLSPLDGLSLANCPGPLLRHATECCCKVPDDRPSLAQLLEQLQGQLDSRRAAARSMGSDGPRVLVAGPADSGKSSLCSELCFVRSRAGEPPPNGACPTYHLQEAHFGLLEGVLAGPVLGN